MNNLANSVKMTRKQLYDEIWEISVKGVSDKYNSPYLKLCSLCKEFDIPIPPSGYWTKLEFGKPVIKTLIEGDIDIIVDLPMTSSKKSKVILKQNDDSKNKINDDEEESQIILTDIDNEIHDEGNKKINSVENGNHLKFLSSDERLRVIEAALKLEIRSEKTYLHSKIVQQKAIVKEWNTKHSKPDGAQRDYKNFSTQPPLLAGVISNETLPRACKILDALFREIESLGGSINDDLTLNVRNEHIKILMSEFQDKVDHVLTKDEAKQLLIYQDEKRHKSWHTYEPKFRKYDYVFNGRMKLAINTYKTYKDSKNQTLESMLGDILIAIYEESENVRIRRLAAEEEARKKEIARKEAEDRREKYNLEIESVKELENEADDYEIACKIRKYVSAMALANTDQSEDIQNWIKWASEKADWFDPTTKRIDEILGERDHSQNEDRKALKPQGRLWWY